VENAQNQPLVFADFRRIGLAGGLVEIGQDRRDFLGFGAGQGLGEIFFALGQLAFFPLIAFAFQFPE